MFAMTEANGTWIDRWRVQPLEVLTERLRVRGADGPEGWARSELDEDIPQTARYLFLRALWNELTGTLDYAAGEIEALVASGTATRERIEASLASSLYTLGCQLAFLLDEPDGSFDANGEPMWVREDEPRWRLSEMSPDGQLTGRDVGGLHESLMETAPGGEHGARERGWF